MTVHALPPTSLEALGNAGMMPPRTDDPRRPRA